VAGLIATVFWHDALGIVVLALGLLMALNVTRAFVRYPKTISRPWPKVKPVRG
jgi:hypothetical protein